MTTLNISIPLSDGESYYVETKDAEDFYPFFHRHEECQLIWIKRGKGTLFVEGQLHAFSEGSLFFLGSNQRHLFRKDPSFVDNVRYLSIYFSLSGNFGKLLSVPELSSFLKFLSLHQQGFRIPDGCRDKIVRQLDMLSDVSAVHQILILVQIIVILATQGKVLDPLDATVAERLDREISNGRIEDICKFIRWHSRRHLSLERVASRAHLSPPAFCRYFKKHMGMTFIQYLQHVRVANARSFLNLKGERTFSQIAYASGFNSISSFNKAFKAVNNETPSQYLKKIKDVQSF